MGNLRRLSLVFLFFIGFILSLQAQARCTNLFMPGAIDTISFLGPDDLLTQARKVLNRDLTTDQSEAIIKAHYVGLGELGKDRIHDAGLNNFTRKQLAIKTRVLRLAGLSVADVRALMKNGIVGFEIFLAGYGVARLGMDLWAYFTYTPATVQNLKKEFTQQRADSSIRNPKDLFEEMFKSFRPGWDDDNGYIQPIGSRVSSHEYTVWKRKFDRHEQAAFLIKKSDGSAEMLVGRAEPMASEEEKRMIDLAR